MFKGLTALILIGVCAVLVLAYTFGSVVSPGFMGVRQISFGPYAGFSDKALPPGYHWSIPFYSKIHMVPATIQQIVLDRNKDEHENTYGSIEVQTTDGSSVEVDSAILTRFYSQSDGDKHGGPSDLIQKLDVYPKRWMDRIQTAAVNEIRKALGRLSTSQFYDPHLREAAVEEAQKELAIRLAPFGVSVESILLRRYTYTEERIDTAIFQKNLQDQEERLNTSLSLLSEAKAELEKVAAEWDAKIKTLRVEGDNKARVLKSEADLYETQRKAEADLLVAKAHAEVDKLKAGALAKSVGADIYVGRELAPLLTSLRGGVISDIDPYDMNKWIGKLGVSGGE